MIIYISTNILNLPASNNESAFLQIFNKQYRPQLTEIETEEKDVTNKTQKPYTSEDVAKAYF